MNQPHLTTHCPCTHYTRIACDICTYACASQRDLPNVMMVRFEDYGEESMWRRLEDFLGLAAVEIMVENGKPSGRRLESARTSTSWSDPATARRELVVHGEHGGSGPFVVYLGYLQAKCHADNHVDRDTRDRLLAYGYDCTANGHCSVAASP
tara:strand:- start:688 stop:1143 length:456 start_codon:yes stop_codon:yes gene_type:complete